MSCGKYLMYRIGYEGGLASCITTPEDKYNGCGSVIKLLYNVIRVYLPTHSFMTVSLRLSDCECCIKKKYALLCPRCEFSV